MSPRTICMPALLACLCLPCNLLHADPVATNALFRIPHLARAVIDADPAAWGGNGFRVEELPDANGRLQPAAQFDARLRLAWNEDGLLVRFAVRDSVLRESATDDTLYMGDACEVFLARAPGAPESYQLMIAPGMDPRYAKPRTAFTGRHPPIPLTNMALTVANRETANGYVTEILLPWRNLGLTGAKAGDRVAFQAMVDDAGHGPLFNGTWFPSADTSHNSNSFYTVELADTASPPEGLTAWGEYEGVRLTRFHAVATAAAVGRLFSVVAGGQTLGRAALSNRNDRAEAEIVLPFPALSKPLPSLALRIDDCLIRSLELPNADQLRARAFAAADFTFDACCFPGPGFPSGNFAQPEFVESLIGPYTLGFRYYDAGGRAVTTADRPGRYAAVVEITHGAGRISRRFFTLYRLPNDVRLPREARRPLADANAAPQPHTIQPLSERVAAANVRAHVSLPPDLGISPDMLAAHRSGSKS